VISLCDLCIVYLKLDVYVCFEFGPLVTSFDCLDNSSNEVHIFRRYFFLVLFLECSRNTEPLNRPKCSKCVFMVLGFFD